MPNMILCPHCMTLNETDGHVCMTCGKDMNAGNNTHQLPIGTVLNKRYLVGCAIGGGGFGITYIGYDMLLNIKVAIKEYYPSGAANRSTTATVYPTSSSGGSSFEIGKERFLNEARILSDFIDDANVVTLRDFFEENGTAYIIMEYLDGQDLREYLNEHGAMSFDEALELITPAIKALERIHAKGIIHGDISPSNIMRLSNGEVKILDFGTARNQGGNENYNSSMMLKPGYAPEEQFRQQGELGPWTDVYAISATIYKLITNVTPENSTDRVYGDTLMRPGKLGAKISPAQEAALMKGMAVSAKNRTGTMGELLDSLNRNRLSAADAVKLLFGKRIFRIGVAAAAALLILCLTLTGKKAETSVNTAAVPEQSKTTDATQDSRIQNVTLREDAYPVKMYSGMEKMEGFSRASLLSSSGGDIYISDCFIGNGMLCLIMNLDNRSDDAGTVFNAELTDGYRTVECDLYDEIKPGEQRTVGLWFSTDLMYIQGISNFNRLDLNLTVDGFGKEYESLSTMVYFPETVHIESNIDTVPVTLYSEDNLELMCYGVSLREDNCLGSILLKARRKVKDYKSITCSLDNNEVYADGTKMFSQVSNYKYIGYEDDNYLMIDFNYGYSAPVDEMNVMHSNTQMPKTVTLTVKIGNGNSSDDIIAGESLTFEIDNDGIGHLKQG